MTTENEEELCLICHHPREGHNFHHPFNPPGGPVSLYSRNDDAQSMPSSNNGSAQGRVRIRPAGDPVLRMALIRKGLITVEDLEQVEAELRASGVSSYEPPEALDQS